MKRNYLFTTSLLLTGTLILGAFTGCGSSSTKAASSSVLSDGVLNVGVEGTYAPFTYHDEDGTLTGFDVEIAKAIGEKLGVPVEFTESEWDSLLASVDSGRIDTVINCVTITEEREKTFDFVGPYIYISNQIGLKKGNTEIQSIDDVKGKRLATNITNAHAADWEAMGVEIVPINTAEEAVNLVLSGRADFISTNVTVLAEYLKLHPEAEVEFAFAAPFASEGIGAPVKKGETELQEAMQKAVEELREEGVIEELSQKYFGFDLSVDPNAE